ncbi:hypothetical protein RB628_34770 [Streptomyces sp. ADMS]|nr:hypothetical protein [Streptomyces sp. ADMS]MDW4910355.1 hypothetical protein [Streptomyces sp. ADMS]
MSATALPPVGARIRQARPERGVGPRGLARATGVLAGVGSPAIRRRTW